MHHSGIAPGVRASGNVTINDVARLAGVSAMTVSRVINDAPSVLQTTRERVMEVIKELDFTPNTAARSLAAGTATHVGVLYATPTSSYLSEFLVGILESARGAGCHLVIKDCDPDDPASQRAAVRDLLSARVKGVILPPPLSESGHILHALAAAGTRAVTIAMGEFRNGLNIRIDDFTAAQQMTEHLISLGHRRIGFIKGDPRQAISHQRARGFAAAMKEAGLAVDPALIAEGDFTFRSGLEAGDRLLRREQRPTAIFASNDDMAAGAMTAVHRLGLEIPKHISVAGFDDTGVATLVWPELTTVRQPVSTMANAALALLLKDLRQRGKGKSQAAERVLQHKLVVRRSCGPAPAQLGQSKVGSIRPQQVSVSDRPTETRLRKRA